MPPSRRQCLQRSVGVAVATLLAGCTTDDRFPTTPTASVPTAVDFEAVFVRSQTVEPFVTVDEDETDGPADSFAREVLLTADDADQVSFTRAVDGVDGARTFLDDTDFDRAAVYLAVQRLSACRRLAVAHVSTDHNSFDIEFCSPLRPADVECRTDETDVVAAVVRFPFTADKLSSYRVGGGRSCRRPRPPEDSE